MKRLVFGIGGTLLVLLLVAVAISACSVGGPVQATPAVRTAVPAPTATPEAMSLQFVGKACIDGNKNHHCDDSEGASQITITIVMTHGADVFSATVRPDSHFGDWSMPSWYLGFPDPEKKMEMQMGINTGPNSWCPEEDYNPEQFGDVFRIDLLLIPCVHGISSG